jgi:DNA recombination protein RmuC
MNFSLFFGFLVGSGISGTLVFVWLKSKIAMKETELQLHLAQVEKQASMEEKFKLLASQVLEEKNARFQDQNMKHISIMLDPFKERLKEFEKKVEESYSTERSERGSLRGELSKLIELNLKMTSETENLTRALKGDNKTQGAWGEMILENILERSGLRKGLEYIVQGTDLSLRNEAGQSIRPDVIVRLPDDKHIIVDSKVSMTAFDAYLGSHPDEQEKWAKAHSESVRKHVDSLSSKKYHTADKLTSPDFVILFMPLEAAFALSMKHRPELQQEAWDKQIAIVSPTTLLVTLKMVAAIWKTERQERNALEIAKRGGQLYDKFVGLVSDFENIGRKIEDAQKSHAAVMSKMREGKGNLFSQVDSLRELGVKTEKQLQLETTIKS